MRDVKTHAQFELAAPFNNLFNLYKDVLVALATEVPRERCHGLRNKFHASIWSSPRLFAKGS